MSNSTPPGWYPDPQRGPDGGAAQERYWDGGGWTAQTRPPAAPPRWDAVGPAVPPPHRSVVSDASPAYGHPAVPAPVEPPATASRRSPPPRRRTGSRSLRRTPR
ncbi:DUF2510 domain-containing protein [Kitasatospora mediocidica]|uniref:DUF2510 domain-containing protein n=1 Tax=Kitasatospora mediocidica TaxID=58352 RepID=UPI00055BDAB9|nr:DUF2510 domain-containing protein [Kitasatospora mediocidica]